MRWINCGKKFPEDWQSAIIREIKSKKLIIEERVSSAEPDYFAMENHETLYYSNCEYLDETEQSPADGCPIWYTKDQMFDYLRQRNYSKEIATELSELLSDIPQGAFKKGWEMGRNKDRKREDAYEYLKIVSVDGAKEKPLIEALEKIAKLTTSFNDNWSEIWKTAHEAINNYNK